MSESEQPSAPSALPGWYPDSKTGKSRYWDGKNWRDLPEPSATHPPLSGIAIVGFIASVLSLGAGLLAPGWAVGALLAGFIFSGVALTRIRSGERSGQGFAIAGIAISAISTASLILMSISHR